MINKLINVTELQIDSFELIGFSDFEEDENSMAVFPNVQVNSLRILDSSKQLIQRQKLSQKVRFTLKTLYIANVNIGSEVFPVSTALFSLIKK